MSDEPKRLLDDPETSDLLRGDLEAARSADIGFDTGAGLARLQAAIALPPAPPTAPTGASAGAGKAALWWAAAGLGIVGTAVVIAVTRPDAPRNTAPVVAPVSSAIASATPTVASAPDDVPTVDLSALPVEKAPTALPSASAPMTAEERLRAEMKDLAEIRGSSPAQALERANQGHQRFKGGMFYQEREALANLGADQARPECRSQIARAAVPGHLPQGPVRGAHPQRDGAVIFLRRRQGERPCTER